MTGTNHTAACGAKRLLASIRDVQAGSIDAVERLAAQFERHLGGPRYAMPVVPGHRGANETVRVAVHPGGVTRPSILASIDRALAAFTRRRGAGRYAGLLAP